MYIFAILGMKFFAGKLKFDLAGNLDPYNGYTSSFLY
jgi:hypothetical protein